MSDASSTTAKNAGPGLITVLCVDDNRDIVMMERKIIDMQPDMTTFTGVHEASEFLNAVSVLRPCVAVVDLIIPGTVAPMEAIRQVSEKFPETRVIAFSGYDDADTRNQVTDAGAWGLVSKSGDLMQVIDAIRKAPYPNGSERVLSRLESRMPENDWLIRH